MGTDRSAEPLLSVVMVVRDAAADIEACLAAAATVADEIVVHDTGSCDGTADLVAPHPVRLVRTTWPGDFAAARNAALDDAHGRWVLSVDADERVVTPDAGAALRRRLAGTGTPVGVVAVHNTAPGAHGHVHPAPRLLRRGVVRWFGCVHEHPRDAAGARPAQCVVPADELVLEHHGYADPAARRSKAARNAALAAARLPRLRDDDEAAHTLLALGRSLAGDRREVEACTVLRELRRDHPHRPEAVWAADVLARTLLCTATPDAVEVQELADHLLHHGVDPAYCAWLRAQALARAGDPATALALLERLGPTPVLVDSLGRTLPDEPVLAHRALTLLMLGRRGEAAAVADLAPAHERARIADLLAGTR